MLFELGTLHVKIQGNVFMLPENGFTNIQKKKDFFFEFSNSILKFLHQNLSMAAYFFTVHGTAFSQHIKMYEIICHYLSLL